MFAWRFAGIAVLVGTLVAVVLTMEWRQRFRDLTLNEAGLVSSLKTRVDSRLNAVISDLSVLKGSGELADFVNAPGEDTLARLRRRFLSFAESTQRYDQVRLLGVDGREVARVDLRGSRDYRVAADRGLQDKSSRDYFQEGMKIGDDQYYVSPMNLNVENGVVEKPWKPMIRFVAKVFDERRRPRGLLVLNFLAGRVIDELRMHDTLAAGSMMLLNDQGHWLYGGAPGEQWGFMFGIAPSFVERFPEEWSRIADQPTGQLVTANGVFSFVTYHFPVDRAVRPLSNVGTPHQWKLVSFISRDRPELDPVAYFRWLSWALPMMLVAIAALAWLWARSAHELAVRRRRLEQLSRVVEQSSEVVMVTDAQGTIQYVNPSFERVTGYRAEEALGKTPSLLKSGRYRKEYYKQMWETVKAGGVFEEVFVNRRKDGALYYEEKVISPIRDAGGRVVQLVSTGRDVTEMKKMKRLQRRLHELAYTDELTGLPNRPSILQALSQAMALSDRMGQLMALLFIDLDGFKEVNDRHGHEVGDELLERVARRLRSAVRESDMVGRLGGDEFVAMLMHIDRVEHAEGVVRKLIEGLARPFTLADGAEAVVTCSVGVVVHPFDGEAPESLLACADAAMYRAKALGKNRFVHYQHGMGRDHGGEGEAGRAEESPRDR